MVMIIIGLVFGVGGITLGNYLLNETIKFVGIFLGGLFIGAGAARHPKVMKIADETEKQIEAMEAKIQELRAKARASRQNKAE